MYAPVNNYNEDDVRITYTLAGPKGDLHVNCMGDDEPTAIVRAETVFKAPWWQLKNLGYEVVQTNVSKVRG